MPNEQYQALFGASEEVVRGAAARRRSRRDARRASARLLDAARGDVGALVRDLGGHDLGDVLDGARRGARDGRPADRRLRLHDQGLRPRDRRTTAEPLRAPRPGSRSTAARASVGLEPETEWDGFAPGTPEGDADRRRAPAPRPAARAAGRVVRRARDALRARPAGADLDAGGVRPRPARPLARRGRRRAARHGLARRRASRRTSAASSTRPASGRPTRSRSTTRWRTRR